MWKSGKTQIFVFSTITDILRKKSTAPLLYSMIAIGCLVSALQMIDKYGAIEV